MNDTFALRLDQLGALNREDGTINILYQKYILDSTNGLCAYAFLCALCNRAERELAVQRTTPPPITPPLDHTLWTCIDIIEI